MSSSAEDALVEELVVLAIGFDGLRRTVRLDLEQRIGQQALGDVELLVLALLWRSPGRDAAAIAREVERPQPAVRRALVSLLNQGLVAPREEPAGPESAYVTTMSSEELRLLARERLAHHLRYALAGLSPANLEALAAAGPALQRLAVALGP